MTTPRENLLRTLKRQGFESVPVDFVFCDAQIAAFRERFGRTDYASYFDMSHREVELPLKKQFTAGRTLYKQEQLPVNVVFDEWGLARSSGSAQAFHMKRLHHPLQGSQALNEIENFPLPIIDDDQKTRFLAQVKRLHQQGLAVLGFMPMTIWEIGWYLRSLEDLFMDMMQADSKAVLLLDRLTEHACQRAAVYAAAPVDILVLGDDIGTQKAPIMPVAMWRSWLKPRLAQVIGAARKVQPEILIYYHSCGHIEPFIQELIEIGVDILNPVQPECNDFNRIHALYGERLSFWGTLGTQDLLPFGSPEDVRGEVFSRLEQCGPSGGIVLGPAHMVEPEVPWDNLLAVKTAVQDFIRPDQKTE